MKLMGLHSQNLVPPKVPPKAEMEDLTPTTDTDSDSSGGTGRRRGQPMRTHVRNTSQTDQDVNRILSDGGEAAESCSLVSSGSSPGKVATSGGAGSPGRVSSTSSVDAGSPVKKVDSPVCEESFSAMKGQDLPFADSIPHFSDDDDDNDDDGTVGKTLESDVSEEDLEEQLNVPGLEQEEFSDMEPVGGSPMYPGSPARRRGTTTTTATTQPQEGPLPPPVPSCPPPLSDISSDSEPERPTDEALPEILSVPGVTDLPPPAPSFELMSDDETEGQPGSTEELPPPKLSPDKQETTGKLQEQPGTAGTQSGGLSPGKPRQITAIPEEPLQYKISPSQPPPVTKFKYVRSDSDVPPPPPPMELLQASAMHEISSEEEVEMPELEHENLADLEAQLAAGQVVIPPPVAPTELSSGSEEADPQDEEDVVDLDQALSASSRIVGQLVAAEFHTAHGTAPDNVQELLESNGAINTQGQPERNGTKPTQGQVHEISSESDVCEDDRAKEMEDLEAALWATGRRGMAPPAPVEISSEEDMRYPEEDEDLHGDIQEALREGRTIVPGTGVPHVPPPLDVSSGDSDPGQPDDESLPEIDQFEKKFELHIEEDEESVTCLPEGAEHMITPLEGAGVESLSSSGAGGRRSSGSTSSESALEMKGAVGAIMGGMVSTAGLPLQISSESEGEEGAGGVPPPDDLPDPMDVLEANVVLANPYMMGDDEFSEHPQELPPPPPPPGALQHLTGAHDVTSTTATTSIINQYYGAAAPGSMQTSGPMGAQRRQPPKAPPKPPTRNSSSMQRNQPAVESGGQGVPTRAGYYTLHGGEDSDSSGAGVTDENAVPQEYGDLDRLEALEALRHPYIVHRSDSSGSDRQDVSDSDDSTSDSEEDFEEIPESIIRTRQLGRHHVGIEVARNRRYRNQVNIQVSSQDTAGVGSQQHHIYQNVNLSGEPLVQQPDTGQQASDPGHIYQNLRATVSHSNGTSATKGSSSSEGAYQPLRPLTAGSQSTQQEVPSQGARSPQAEVFSNPYAESFGAQISPAAAAAPSGGEVTSSRSPSSRSSQDQTRSRVGAGRSSRASQSDSD